MNCKRAYLSLAILAAMVLLSASASAEDTPSAAQAAGATVAVEVENVMAAEELSIYGEIQAVDTEGSGSLTVQYYDYDSDDEKTVTISLDAGTKFENANSINDIVKGDWADVTYSANGAKNIALSIIVEKEEEIAAPMASEQAVTKEEALGSEDIPY